MTGDKLRDLMHEVADQQPMVRVASDTYRRGRRRHRLRSIAAAGAVLTIVAIVGSAVMDLVRTVPPEPAGRSTAAAMPARIYAVPERLASSIDNGYRWDPGVAVEGLAIGTTAAIYPVNGGAVVAVSALDGSYAGLELPGFDENAYFRFEDVSVALSPDGDRLAYTWNPYVVGSIDLDGYQPSGVRIVDLGSGKVTSVRIPGGYGVFAHGFSWSPDGRYLAYNLDVTTDGHGGVSGTRNFRMERLDTETEERIRLTGMPRTDFGPAVSNRGEVAVVGNGTPRTWLPGRQPRVRKFPGGVGEWTAEWSPSGDLIAAGSWDRGWFSVGAPAGSGLLSRTASDAPAGSMVRVVGWVGEGAVALLHRSTNENLEISQVPIRALSDGEAQPLVELEPAIPQRQLSVATDLLGRPTREFREPAWPIDWSRMLTWTGVGAGVVVVGGWLWARRRSHEHFSS